MVRFQEPSATPLSQPPAVTLLDVMRNWQATNQPGAPQATQEDLLALVQLMQSQGSSRGPQAPAQQLSAYGGQSCGGAGSTFGQSPVYNPHLGQQQLDAPYGSQPLPGTGFSGAGFGGVSPSGGFGVGALQPRSEMEVSLALELGCRAQQAPSPEARGARAVRRARRRLTHADERHVAVEALLELAKVASSSFGSRVAEQRRVLMESRCPRWYSAVPIKGYSALQDIKPCLDGPGARLGHGARARLSAAPGERLQTEPGGVWRSSVRHAGEGVGKPVLVLLGGDWAGHDGDRDVESTQHLDAGVRG